jgi:transient receptor potential cation channel subfamily V member 5
LPSTPKIDATLIKVHFQDKDEHLDLLEGVLIDLLKTKWETFVKAKFYRQFYLFAIYFFISLFAFGLRPKAIGSDDDDDSDGAGNSTREFNASDTTNAPVKSLIMHNLTEILCNYSAYQEALVQSENATDFYDNSTLPIDDSEWTSFSECPLLDISTLENRIKLVAEGLLTIGALYYILTAMRELRFLGAKMFFENLVSQRGESPMKVLTSLPNRALPHHVSCFCFPAG